MHDQVDVIRHEDERPERELQIDTRRLNGVSKPLACAILGQKWKPAKATEGQLVSVAGLVY
jgi:hypothetical protein